MINPVRIERFVDKRFSRFGVNRQMQITRLIYEIAKREGLKGVDIFPDKDFSDKSFTDVRDYLLSRRYPRTSPEDFPQKAHFTKVDVPLGSRVRIKSKLPAYPKKIYVEEGLEGHDFVRDFLKKFPRIKPRVIKSYTHYVKSKEFSVKDYNNRLENFFLVKEKYDFLCPCPCTKGAVCCGYQILNAGFGCGFECVYCYLQSYTNAPGIVIPVNIEDFFKEFKKLKNKSVRIGTGQFTDSLIFDHLTGFSRRFVEFFKDYPQTRFEIKTKSDQVAGLLNVEAAPNVIVGFSMNPQKIIQSMEFYTASLSKRLAAARKCARHGYGVAFHFDPIIFYPGWEKDYADVVRRIFQSVEAEKIAWISLGTMRMTPKQKQRIESRFPDNTILDEEFVLGYDRKLRYRDELRREIYAAMRACIRQYSRKVWVYLCMEDRRMSGKIGLRDKV